MFVGISDKISKTGTTDIPEEEYLVHARRRPWEDWHSLLEHVILAILTLVDSAGVGGGEFPPTPVLRTPRAATVARRLSERPGPRRCALRFAMPCPRATHPSRNL